LPLKKISPCPFGGAEGDQGLGGIFMDMDDVIINCTQLIYCILKHPKTQTKAPQVISTNISTQPERMQKKGLLTMIPDRGRFSRRIRTHIFRNARKINSLRFGIHLASFH
jgi:hypothetical protein